LTSQDKSEGFLEVDFKSLYYKEIKGKPYCIFFISLMLTDYFNMDLESHYNKIM